MRRAAKVDDNQGEIVDALRQIGASVTLCHGVGNGFPDLAVGWQDKTYLLEVKDGDKPPSARALTPAQVEWHLKWRGHKAVVENVREALEAIGIKWKGTIE